MPVCPSAQFYPPPGGVFTGWFGCTLICINGPCSCQFPGYAVVAMFFVMSRTGDVVLHYVNSGTGFAYDVYSSYTGAEHLDYNLSGSYCPEPNFPEFGTTDCPENREFGEVGNAGGHCAWYDHYTGPPVDLPTPNPPAVWTEFGRWSIVGPMPDWEPPPDYPYSRRTVCVGANFGFLRNKVCLFFCPETASRLLVGPVGSTNTGFYIFRAVYVIYTPRDGAFVPTGRNVMVKVWERDLAHVNEEYGFDTSSDPGAYADLANYPLSGGGFGDYIGFPVRTDYPQTMTGGWPDEIVLDPGTPDDAWLGEFGPYSRCGPLPQNCFCGITTGVITVTVDGKDWDLLWSREAKAWVAVIPHDDGTAVRVIVTCAGNVYCILYDAAGTVICRSGPTPIDADCVSGAYTVTTACCDIIIKPPATNRYCYSLESVTVVHSGASQTSPVHGARLGVIVLAQVGTSSVWTGTGSVEFGTAVGYPSDHTVFDVDVTFDDSDNSMNVTIPGLLIPLGGGSVFADLTQIPFTNVSYYHSSTPFPTAATRADLPASSVSLCPPT